MKHVYLIGIDEVGRGPVAGPVTLGAAVIHFEQKKKLFGGSRAAGKMPGKFKGLKESKQLTAVKREEWLKKMDAYRELRVADPTGDAALFLDFSVSSITAGQIDARGLSWAIKTALDACLKKLETKHSIAPADCLVLLDGGLHAPARYPHQKTIIKGDEKETIIAMASIAAKVTRDTTMIAFSKIYPHYDFEVHKGYGTAGHYKKLRTHGISPLHRKSFLKGRKALKTATPVAKNSR